MDAPDPAPQVSTARRGVRRARRTVGDVGRRIRRLPPSNFPLHEVYSVDLWRGRSPFELEPTRSGPVLTAASARAARSFYPADPFLVRQDGRWWILYELLRWTDVKGVIGVAVSDDLVEWTHLDVVLEERVHLSYPHPVRDDDGQLYVVPESSAAGGVRLYKATDFPKRFEPVADLLEGPIVDATPFRHEGRWYMFSCDRPRDHDRLRLHVADELRGPWTEHPSSPIVDGDATRARPAGRVFEWAGRPVRVAQVCEPMYGTAVRAFRITELGPDRYAEEEVSASPVLGPGLHGVGWNDGGMHHLDVHPLTDTRWIGLTDGWRRR